MEPRFQSSNHPFIHYSMRNRLRFIAPFMPIRLTQIGVFGTTQRMSNQPVSFQQVVDGDIINKPGRALPGEKQVQEIIQATHRYAEKMLEPSPAPRNPSLSR